MCTMQSGTGVYYQAMPAVGPDGKNVMKLIPVKKVNGHFVHSQVLPSRNVPLPVQTSPVLSPQNRIPTLQPTADGRFILKTPLDVNTVFNSVKSQHRGPNALLQSSGNQVHIPPVTHNMTQNMLQLPSQANKAVLITNSTQLLNTVKPPMLPSGHYLQIPSNATVRTLPASALPSSVQNRICHSTNDSNSVKGLPMVLYVSPVSSLKLDQQAPCLKTPSELPQTLSRTSATGVVKSPEETARNNQGGTTPMKWVVEERAGSSAPYLIPVTSPNMSSDILKAVKRMESSRFPNQVTKEPVSANTSTGTVTPGNDNALVMCNGKVYFVAKKTSELTKDLVSNVESKLQPRKPVQSPTATLGTGTSSVTQKQDPKSPVDHKKMNDIIDLCDDDEESSTTVCEHDDDSNVIFVSYIPPKSAETETREEVTAPEIEVTAPEIEVTAPEIEVTAPEIEVTAPEIEVTAPEITEEVTAPEITEEVTAPEITEEVTAPEITEEVTAPEITEEVRAPEITEEVRAPEITEEVRAPEITEEVRATEITEEVRAAEASVADTATTSVTSCVKDRGDAKLDIESMETDGELDRTCSAELDATKCAVVHANGPALEGNEALAQNPEVVCGQQTDVPEKSFEEMVPEQIHRPRSDSELRQTFGITADLSVSLEKIAVSPKPQAREGPSQTEKRLINKRTLDGVRKLIRDSTIETKIKRLIQTQVSKSPKSGKRKRLERNSEINGSNAFPLTDTHSSPPSNSLAERDHESRSSSAEQSTDRQPFQTCQGTQEESVQTRTARCQSDSPDCCSGLRKTPPRSSKGCGRVCTACPCGTKVGGVAGNSASKPQEKPNPYSSVNSSKSLSYASNTDVTTVNRLADSVSGSTASNSASGVEMTPGSQSHVRKDVKGTMPTAAVLTSQPKGQPARKGSSSCTQGKTHAKSTSHQLETGAQTPSTPIEVKKVPSSVQQLYTSYKIPSELYSSVLLDPEEIKRQERIKRLKDLLQEKEAALEKLRKSM